MKILLGLLFVGYFLGVNAQDKKKVEVDKKLSSITYAMKHPLHSWTAISKDLKCVLVYDINNQKIESVAVAIPVKSFDSGNSNRDSHAVEVLEALKYPNVTFSGKVISETENQIIAKGNLNFHGVSKPIEIKASKSNSSGTLSVVGSFEVNMLDYNITPPGLMGLKTNDVIQLIFDLKFKL
jgi:polyisoprenoid-binding protein YceI